MRQCGNGGAAVITLDEFIGNTCVEATQVLIDKATQLNQLEYEFLRTGLSDRIHVHVSVLDEHRKAKENYDRHKAEEEYLPPRARERNDGLEPLLCPASALVKSLKNHFVHNEPISWKEIIEFIIVCYEAEDEKHRADWEKRILEDYTHERIMRSREYHKKLGDKAPLIFGRKIECYSDQELVRMQCYPGLDIPPLVCSALCNLSDCVTDELKEDFDNDLLTGLDYHFLCERISHSLTNNEAIRTAEGLVEQYMRIDYMQWTRAFDSEKESRDEVTIAFPRLKTIDGDLDGPIELCRSDFWDREGVPTFQHPERKGRYDQKKFQDELRVMKVLHTFNIEKEIFLVQNFAGHPRICWTREEKNHDGRGTKQVMKSQAPWEWKQFFQDEKIITGVNEDDEPIVKTKAEVWLAAPHKNKYEELTFLPNRETPPHIKNLWSGFAFEPVKGNCELFLEHLHDNICSKNQEHFNFLIKWMAQCFQHPDIPGEVCIVLGGKKGTGKNFYADNLGALLGPHYAVYSDKQRVTRNFNSHLMDKCLATLDETFYANDHASEGILKALITGRTIQIEKKGHDIFEIPNILHLIMLSNADRIAPTTIDERRFFCLKVAETHRKDYEYFGKIQQQLDDKGYSGLLHYLLNMDIHGFNYREAPSTEFLDEQTKLGLQGIDSVWFEMLSGAEFPGAKDDQGRYWLRTSDLILWAEEHQKSARYQSWDKIGREQLGRFLTKMNFGKGKAQGVLFQDRTEGRVNAYQVPALAECRKRWKDAGYPAGDWDANDEWEICARVSR